MPLLKDFVDRSTVERLGRSIAAVFAEFPLEDFVAEASAPLDELELKARIDHIGKALGRSLPADFPAAAAVVATAVEHDGLDGWAAWPLNAWLERAGIRHFGESILLMERLTRRASSEFAVRPFIDAYPDEMRRELDRWARSADPHVRRLASEGSRPRLPWAPRLAVAEQDPTWAIFVLDLLRDDESEDVRRSVANHLNDISKADRDAALAIAERWHTQGGRHVASVLRHGLRTLVKRGDSAALRLVGADTSSSLSASALSLANDRLALGETLDFSFRLVNEGETRASVVVDYAIHFVKANGGTARKVFKLRTVELAPGAQIALSRRLPLRSITTRRYYSGRHLLEIQANGRVLAAARFDLAVPAGSAGSS